MPKLSSSAPVREETVLSRLGGAASGVWRRLARRPVDSLALAVAIGLVSTIVVNAVALQAGPHPAPISKSPPVIAPAPAAAPPAAPKAVTTGSVAPNEPAVAAVPDVKDPASKRTRAQLLTEIQKELARRGFYDGTVDGVMGPKMEAAIRAFEQAARMRVTGEASEALLKALQRAPAKTKQTRGGDNSTKRILSVQRALTDFGYGPVPPTGVFGEATRAAIEKFERDRKLTPSGRLSDRVLRELAAVTGRSFE